MTDDELELVICQCADSLCPVHRGTDCDLPATRTLYRVDMEDLTGTSFCEACANDALQSGLFFGRKTNESNGD